MTRVLTRREFEQCHLTCRNALIGAAFLFPVPPDATLDLRYFEEDEPRMNCHETDTA